MAFIVAKRGRGLHAALQAAREGRCNGPGGPVVGRARVRHEIKALFHTDGTFD
ncbi:MAG: hypothetical protein WCB48_05050 [Casimicrobiaceae bacterium]